MKTVKRLFTLTIFSLLWFAGQSFAQVLIAPSPGEPHASAALEVRSESGGLLIPTIELNKVGFDAVAPTIPSPADGLMIFHDGYKADGNPSGLPKGLWYFDASAGASGRWVIYTRTGTVFSSNLDNFGEMYEIHEMGQGTSITLNSQYSIPWNNAVEGLTGPGFSVSYDQAVNTEQSGITATADQLVIDNSTGPAYYTAAVSTTIITNTSGNIVSGQLFVNDQPQQSIFFRHAFQTSGEYVNCSTSGIIVLTAGDKIDFRFKSTTTGEVIFVENLNLKLTKIGEYE